MNSTKSFKFQFDVLIIVATFFMKFKISQKK